MTGTTNVIRRALCALTCLGLSACADNPRTFQLVSSTDAPQVFSGYIEEAGGTVTVQLRPFQQQRSCNGFDPWQNYFTIKASTSPAFTDACGKTWYRFQGSAALQGNPRYWCISAHFAFYEADYRMLWKNHPIPTFSPDAESNCHPSQQCMSTLESECGDMSGIAAMRCNQIPQIGAVCTTTF